MLTRSDLARLLDRLLQPFWLFDDAGRHVVWRNDAARRIFRAKCNLARNGARGVVHAAGRANKPVEVRVSRWRPNGSGPCW
ncbi:MAG: hypothetical protein FJX52_07735, partial [Alphaproteobacteria bacterium]|nr:hypothetical protein [Alphaproteobacteria bacterium]